MLGESEHSGGGICCSYQNAQGCDGTKGGDTGTGTHGLVLYDTVALEAVHSQLESG